MTQSESSSAETHQVAIAAEASGPNPPQTNSELGPRDVTAANVRQSAIQSLENLASSKRPLAELLDEAKELLGSSKREPSGTICGQSEANQRARLTEIEQRTGGGPPSHSAETATRLHRSGRTTRNGRRALLQLMAALGAAAVGYAFGRVVAETDIAMRFFFAAAVAMGLFLVFSAFATQINRRWQRRR